MRTRTFIGLIALIIALLVASTPALLEPSAAAIEDAAIGIGVMPDPAEKWKRESRSADQDGPIDPRMELKGYVVEEDGDLRDLKLPGDREAGLRRLAGGSERMLLPGQRAIDRSAPPVESADGVLLDASGCPTFSETADIAAIFAVPELRQRYIAKIGNADDPTSCQARIEAVIENAEDPMGFPLAGDRRRLAASVRTDSERLMLSLAANGMYEDIFEAWLDAPETATAIRDELGGATG